MLKRMEELFLLANNKPKKRLAVCYAHDEPVIQAVAEALKAGLIHPILIGNQPEIERLAKMEGILDDVEIIAEDDMDQAVRKTMDLVHSNQADLIMKGLIDTKVLLKGVVNKEYGIRNKPLLSHVGLVEVPGFDRLLFITDGAMNIQPTVEEKIQIIENALFLTRKLGYLQTKVGLVSAVEKINPKMLSTVDAEQVKNYYLEHPGDYLVDGPFAIDNLVSLESVKHKGIQSDVAGLADILLFPNIDAGNVFYKTCVFLAHAKAAGIVIGAKVPIVLTSRADDAQAKFASIALGVNLSE